MKRYWSALISILYHLNMMFDRIKEPRRLIVFLGVAMPGMVVMLFPEPQYALAGFSYVMLLIGIRAAFLTDKLNRGKL